MDTHAGNANLWDEWDKWLIFPTQDEPHGRSDTNAGGSGSTDQPKNARKFKPETESNCMRTNIAGKIAQGW